jgi:hypothetical protein
VHFAIVWSRGDEVYTHSDEHGNTITYTRDELDALVGLGAQRIFTTLDSLSIVKKEPYLLHAVPVDTLNHLLGADDV